MVQWYWTIVAFFIGGFFGVLTMGLMIANAEADHRAEENQLKK